ncbi:hypothetical protein LTR09_010137 [Extremus antarcticus]|uniref:C2 domain-containing protein n=1 Tax=Extremus antarcticus TaxID=702011 RepID=A0AAJ0DEE0_9PEZI|nr:hypothetical protein LTR09_010137 [Extremus antarcticus]
MATTNGDHKAAEEKKPNGEEAHGGANGQDDQKHMDPKGGHDTTPIPSPPHGTVGYTVKVTIHQATNLTMGDLHAFSSDPYVLAQVNTLVPTRHKEDPNLRFRTPTIHRNVNPEWNEEWIIANVPSSGFKMKLRVYDEDPADHDDLLGKAHITIPSIDHDWKGVRHEAYQLKLRESSKRALLIRSTARVLQMVKSMHGTIHLSITNLGRTAEDGQNGRMYTVGPCRYVRHYSPILGRIANIKQPEKEDTRPQTNGSGKSQKQVERYNFQANQMQLPGPVPAQLYHRFIEFKPWVKRMFTSKGVQGVILGKALHHQHARVYNFGKDSEWGHFEEAPSLEQTKKFLDLVHYDKGGRIFTYVLTLDALWRFTETGNEFGIDMLSKHTMHSDVSIYIAFSGEFFIRRIKRRSRPPPPNPDGSNSQQSVRSQCEIETHPPHDLEGGPPEDDPPTDPSRYELVIDNDSGTYRPDAAMLPVLAEYLSRSLPGLHIETLDCQADADKMAKMKSEQRERKKVEGDNIIYAQVSDSSSMSSLSSSDDERLDSVQHEYQHEHLQHRPKNAAPDDTKEVEHGAFSIFAKDVKQRQESRMEKLARNARRTPRDGGEEAVTSWHGPKVVAGGE